MHSDGYYVKEGRVETMATGEGGSREETRTCSRLMVVLGVGSLSVQTMEYVDPNKECTLQNQKQALRATRSFLVAACMHEFLGILFG